MSALIQCELGFSVGETVAAAVLPEQPAVGLKCFYRVKPKELRH